MPLYNVPVWISVRAESPEDAASKVDFFLDREAAPALEHYQVEGIDVGYDEDFIENLDEEELS